MPFAATALLALAFAAAPAAAQEPRPAPPPASTTPPPPPPASARAAAGNGNGNATTMAETVVRVRYGYFPEARPIHAGCGRGWYDLALPARGVRYEVECHPQTSGGYVASRLDNLDLDLGQLGSTPWAEAAARGVDAKAVYVSQYMGNSQGILVRPDDPSRDYVGAETPYDLANRTIGVPFGSTMHYHVLFLMELFGLEGKVNLRNMSPTEIVDAWDDMERHPPILDAAGCWGQAWTHLRGGEAPDGLPARLLASAGTLSDWGKPTFVIVGASRSFVAAHPEFMDHFVGMLSRINDSFLDRQGQVDPRNVARWDALASPMIPADGDGDGAWNSTPGDYGSYSYVASMVDAMMMAGETHASPSAEVMYAQRRELEAFVQQSAAEQLTCMYMGERPGSCADTVGPTGQHVATRRTAEFLLEQKVLARLGPLADMGDKSGQPCDDPSTFCGGDIIDGSYLRAARGGGGGGEGGGGIFARRFPVGPYADAVPDVASPEGAPDELLLALENMDEFSGRPPFAEHEVGRPPAGSVSAGDSTCESGAVVVIGNGSPIAGTLGDGAYALPGRSYSDGLSCEWSIVGDGPDSLVEVRFERLRVWAGDYVRVYSDPNCIGGGGVEADAPGPGRATTGGRVLLAQLSGVYGDGDLPNALPPLRAVGCAIVSFATDLNQERAYGVGDGYGDGFLVRYDRDAEGCETASGEGCNGGRCVPTGSSTVWGPGVCECGGRRWGADCSATEFCVGATRVTLANRGTHRLASSGSLIPESFSDADLADPRALHPADAYPNDLDCTFEVAVDPEAFPGGGRLLEFKIFYDLEPTYDLLHVRTGSGPTAETRAVLTGAHSSGDAKTVLVPTDGGGVASLRLTTDMRGRRRGFYALVGVAPEAPDADPARCPAAGQSGVSCEFQHCVADNALRPPAWNATPSMADDPLVLGRVVSQREGEPVPAMPWAPDGGCVWPLLSGGGARALRLIFNSPLDLEPHPETAVGDKLSIRAGDGDSGVDFDLFLERCDSDEACSFPWQTGACGENGGCQVRTAVEVPLGGGAPIATARLVTDRNDRGRLYRGLDFDAHLVRECPTEKGRMHCKHGDGSCIDGLCFCSDGVACDCPCEGEPSETVTVSTGVKAAIVAAAVVPIFLLILAGFLLYRHWMKAAIAVREGELKAFRDSLVGMRTAKRSHVPNLPTVASSPTPPPQIVWCWKETESHMGLHDAAQVVGDPMLCWIKYNEEGIAALELAYQEQGGHGDTSPLPGYVVNFDVMTQTKVRTGFRRAVQRVVVSSNLPSIEVGEELPAELVNEPQLVLVTGDVLQIAKQRLDGWTFGSVVSHVDEEQSRMLKQHAMGGNNDPTLPVSTETGWFPLEATATPTAEELAVLQVSLGAAGAGALEPPATWEPIANPTVVQLYPLKEGNAERAEVVDAFLSTLKRPKFQGRVRVLRVKRIQNLAMWQSYVVKRQTICSRETGVDAAPGSDAARRALERLERHWLWHATNAKDIPKILQQGFNRSFCGKNATYFGKGVYFARDAAFSANPTYARPDANRTQYMMACRVVTGVYCRGQKDALTPNLRDAANNILFDSTVGLLDDDTMASPSIYVTYHDAQAYPEYLIAFKRL